MAKKRTGILTGGGDVPGLNSVIKSVVHRGAELGCEVIGIRRGWEGLTHLDLNDPGSKAQYILPLNRENTRTIDRTGGTFLHTSRTNPSHMKALPPVLEGRSSRSARDSPATRSATHRHSYRSGLLLGVKPRAAAPERAEGQLLRPSPDTDNPLERHPKAAPARTATTVRSPIPR